jgi:iron(III) transport system substrate-binding protein
MKKVFIILIIGLLTVSFLGAAGQVDKSVATEKPVMVYSPQGEKDVNYIIEAAKNELPFEVEILRLSGGGALTDRLMAESGNPQADVVFGVVPLSMYQLKDEGILTPYTPSWAKGLPLAYQDSEHYFHSFWQTPIVLAYNADQLSEAQAPKGWLDLVKPQYKGMYAIDASTRQTVRTYLAGMLVRFYDSSTGKISDEGWAFMRTLYENARDCPKGDAYYQEVAAGKMPIILNWFGGIEAGAELNNINVSYINSEGGTPVIAEAIALVNKKTPNKNAQAFIDWFGSADFQARMARDLGKAPAHPDALALSDPIIKDKLSFFTAQEIDWGIVSDNIYDWLEKIELEIIP